MEDLGIGQKVLVPTQARALAEVVGSYTYFAEGDVLLAKITPCFENGKLGIAQGLSNGIGFGSSEYVVFRPGSLLDKEWLYYFLSRETFRQEGAKRMSGAVGHKRVSMEFIETYPIPLPPLAEQRRIIAVLDEAFEGIDTAAATAEKNLVNARELFDSYLNSVFLQKGDGWVDKKLEELIDITHGYAFDGSDFQISNDPDKHIVLTPGNYTEQSELSFTPKNTKRFNGSPPTAYLFDPGDLTVVMTDLSSKMKILGKPAFVTQPNILHNQRIGRVRLKTCEINSKYLYYFFQTAHMSNEIKRTSTGTMVRHTAPKRILSITIPFPKKLCGQDKIIDCLDELSKETQRFENVCRQKLAALADLRQAILQRAFTGKLTAQANKALEEAAE